MSTDTFNDPQHNDETLGKNDQADSAALSPIEIHPEVLSVDALGAILEEFVLREGTDYGSVELSLETKIERLRRQLDRGDLRLLFDPSTESVTIVEKK